MRSADDTLAVEAKFTTSEGIEPWRGRFAGFSGKIAMNDTFLIPPMSFPARPARAVVRIVGPGHVLYHEIAAVKDLAT